MLNTVNYGIRVPLKSLSQKYANVNFKGSDQTEEKPVVRVAVNGATGRIGKNLFRQWAASEVGLGTGIVTVTSSDLKERTEKSPAKFEIIAMNVGKRMSEEGLENAMGFDTAMGNAPYKIKAKRDEDGKMYLYVGSGDKQRRIRILEQRNVVADEKNPALPWKELNIDVAIDATGKFTKRAQLNQHIEAGAKKAICSAPAKGETEVDNTIVYGINQEKLLPTQKLLSNASCTTTCIAPVIKLMNEEFGVESGFIETCHAATQSQFILDKSIEEKDTDLAKNRGSLDSMIPTTTGAAKAIGLVIPELNGKLNGLATRVPTNNVSIAYIVLNVKQDVTKDQVIQALEKAEESPGYKDLLKAAPKGATSRDMMGRHESSLYIKDQVQVINKKMVVIPAFYDNEWGYTRSLSDLTKLAGAQIYNPSVKTNNTGANFAVEA